MNNNILYALNIGTIAILFILTLINNIRMNNFTKSGNYDITKFKKLKTVVNVFNYSRFVYLPILYILFKYTNNQPYSLLGMLIILLIQIIIQIIIYNLTSTSKETKE